LNVMELFTHPLGDYNFVIHIHASTASRYSENIHPDSAALNASGLKRSKRDSVAASEGAEVDLISFDPVASFFDDLQRIYADTVLFFMDPLGGTVIGAIWNPKLLEARPFKVFANYSTEPHRERSDVGPIRFP